MLFKIRFGRIGQSLTEYAILIGIVSVVLIGMQIYMKRGIQAAIKVVADTAGPQQSVSDVNKGELSESKMYTVSSATEHVRNLPEEDNSQHIDISRTSRSTGESVYKSRQGSESQ